MKMLWDNLITSVSADSEDSNFPASSLLNRSPKRIWKAVNGVSTATLTVETSAGVSSILIAGTNALSVSIVGADPNAISWAESDEWAEGDTWVSPEVNVSGSTIQRSRSQTVLVQLTTTVDIPVVLKITITCDISETVMAGVIMSGTPETFGGGVPKYGFEEGRKSLSINEENSNGSRYDKKRDILRTFSIKSRMKEASASMLLDIYEDVEFKGAGWKLTDEDNNNVVVYARFDGAPVKSRDYHGYSNVSFNLIEVL